MKRYQYVGLMEDVRGKKPLPLLYITTGKHKGKTGEFVSESGNTLEVRVHDDVCVTYHYTKYEIAGEDGKPAYAPVIDMTGRVVEIDSWVCFSTGTSYSHSLQIGRVTKITASGALVVLPALRNGKKVSPNMFWRNEVNVNDPDRCLKLPIEVSTMTMWLLKDFDDIKDGLDG